MRSKVDYWLTEDGLTLLRGWARRGLIDEQIAHNMGISVRTLYRWEQDNCQISQALSRNKDIVDDEVEEDLLRAAHEGNVTAQIFWLKNRRKKIWRDKPEDDVNEAVLGKAIEILGDVESAID